MHFTISFGFLFPLHTIIFISHWRSCVDRYSYSIYTLHITSMAAMLIYGKHRKNRLLRNQKAYDIDTWYVALGARVLPRLFKWWPWVDTDLFYGNVRFGPYAFDGRCSQLNEYMNLYEYQSSRTFINLGHRSLRFNMLGWLKQNFTWSLLGMGTESEYINGLCHKTNMDAMLIYGKNLRNPSSLE